MPIQVSGTENPGTPPSATVGTSGAALARDASITPIARSLPDFTCGSTFERIKIATGICPPTTSFKAGAPPL